MTGIYLHVPFCVRKCPYCDFYSLAGDDALRGRYLTALLHQIASFPPAAADTVYFGGGTPSQLAPAEIARVMEALAARFSLAPDAEVTMECNPATADRAKLAGFRAAGVNRLSVGCQSFDDATLRILGRLHGAEQARQTVRDAAAAGFGNISVDVMLGVPYETPQRARADAAEAAALGVQHVSAYLLKICEGTPFADGVAGLPPDDAQAACYEAFCETLCAAGYEQYEISNFAQAGFESRHNLKYWRCGQWLGFGPAAHMSDGHTRRSSPRDLAAFLAAYEAGPVADPLALMTQEGTVDAEEYILMALRTREGLSLTRLREQFGAELGAGKRAFLARCEREGLAALSGDTLRLTREGFLVSNAILAELI